MLLNISPEIYINNLIHIDETIGNFFSQKIQKKKGDGVGGAERVNSKDNSNNYLSSCGVTSGV